MHLSTVSHMISELATASPHFLMFPLVTMKTAEPLQHSPVYLGRAIVVPFTNACTTHESNEPIHMPQSYTPRHTSHQTYPQPAADRARIGLIRSTNPQKVGKTAPRRPGKDTDSDARPSLRNGQAHHTTTKATARSRSPPERAFPQPPPRKLEQVRRAGESLP